MNAPPTDDDRLTPEAGDAPPGEHSSPVHAGPDLRLVGPAAAAWLTALILLGASAAVAYLVAGASLAAVAVLLIRPIGRAFARPAPADARLRPAHGRTSQDRDVLAAADPALPARSPDEVGRPERSGAMRTATAAVLICVAASAFGVGARLAAVASGPVRALAKRESTARLDAVVTGDPKAVVKTGAVHHRETVIVPVRVERVGSQRVRVPVLAFAAGPSWKGLLPSRHVRFTARLTTPDRGRLLAAIALVRGPPTTLGAPSMPQRVAGAVRLRLRAAVSHLPGDQCGVLPGMVDGDTSLLRPDLADAFEKAGLTHLMAVSGENLSLILGAVLGLGRFAGLGRRAGPLLMRRRHRRLRRAGASLAERAACRRHGRRRTGRGGRRARAPGRSRALRRRPGPRSRRSGAGPVVRLRALGVRDGGHPRARPGLARPAQRADATRPRRGARRVRRRASGLRAPARDARHRRQPVRDTGQPPRRSGRRARDAARRPRRDGRAVLPRRRPPHRVAGMGLAVGWITSVARFFASMPYAVIGW